jgi:hypothetical protein
VKTKIINLLKKIILPPFCFPFKLSLIDLRLNKRLRKRLQDLDAAIINENENGYQFRIETSILLNRPGLGNTVVDIVYGRKEFDVNLYFKFRQRGFIAFSFLIGASLISIDVANRDWSAKSLLTTFGIFIGAILIGHLNSWITSGRDAQRAKKLLIDIGE